MADVIYNRFRYNIGKKLIDLTADTIKCALIDNTYTPAATGNVWADVSAKQCSGANYPAGGIALANKSLTEDDAGNNAKFDADNVLFANVTLTAARYAILYDDTLAGDDLICCLDLGADQTIAATDFTVKFNDLGILTV